ncbi:MAG: hypothetical protein KDA41_06295, partial [Planctomycetales bacterium]|nr:hypothetical protein [Planctomycetales bacterium]
MKAKRPATNNAAASLPWGLRTRRIVSLLLAFHLAAVFVAPWSSPPPASQLSASAARLFHPYLHAVCIYNGYRFFAPDPGPSHIVRYELQYADGRSEPGQFPDI